MTSRAGGAFAEVSLLAAAPRGHALHAVPTRPETTSSLRAFTASRHASPSRGRRASTSRGHRSAPRLKAATRRRRRAPRHERPKNRRARLRYARGPTSHDLTLAALGGEPRERRPGRPRGHLLRMVSALGVYSFALADTAPVLRRRDTAVYCHAVATSPAYRSRAGSSGSLQAGSRLVARVRPRPDPATPFWACEVPFSPSLEASDAPRFGIRRSGFRPFAGF